MQWGRSYMIFKNTTGHNWIWEDNLRPGTKCRKCGRWSSSHTSKGKGYGRPVTKLTTGSNNWLETPPGLAKLKPLKRTKVQQEATELKSTTWPTILEDIQGKLQALGLGPTKPDKPELKSKTF